MNNKIFEHTIIWLGISIIILNGLNLDSFRVDSSSIIIYFILNLTYIVRYVNGSKAVEETEKINDEIEKAKSLLSKLKVTPKKTNIKFNSYETFGLADVKDSLKTNAVVAMGALSYEIESIFNKILGYADNEGRNISLESKIKKAYKNELLNKEQESFLIQVADIGIKVLKGADISKVQVKELVRYMEKFNKSFNVGYSINFEPNVNFEKNDLVCEWAHCVELAPIIKDREISFCARFAHDCPGGKERVQICNKSILDIPNKIFVKFAQTSLFDEAKN